MDIKKKFRIYFGTPIRNDGTNVPNPLSNRSGNFLIRFCEENQCVIYFKIL